MKLASRNMARVPRVVMMTNNHRKRRSTTRAMNCQSPVIWMEHTHTNTNTLSVSADLAVSTFSDT